MDTDVVLHTIGHKAQSFMWISWQWCTQYFQKTTVIPDINAGSEHICENFTHSEA